VHRSWILIFYTIVSPQTFNTPDIPGIIHFMGVPDFPPTRQHPTETGLAARIEDLRNIIRALSPSLLAEHTGTQYAETGNESSALHLAFFQSRVTLPFPELIAKDANNTILPDMSQALLLYYFATSDGIPLANNWVSFADLPGGRMYAHAFQGYSGSQLVKAFDPDLDRFCSACLGAGGTPSSFGDVSFEFLPLPRVPLLVNYWLGDEDFPSTCKILFDAAATHYLPIDVCAILGGMLVSRIQKQQ
jgi:hypothetical protein